MNRTRWIIGGAAAAVILASSVGVGMTLSRTTTDAAPAPTQTAPAVGSTPTSFATPPPGVTSTPPAAPPTIDPAYGDVVVESAADGSATTSTGLAVELVSVTETAIDGSGIGSTSGPAIEVSVRVTNSAGASVTLATTVNAYAGAQRTPLTPDHETPVASALAAGEASVGSYTFAVDDAADSIWITVSTSADSGLVVFEHDR